MKEIVIYKNILGKQSDVLKEYFKDISKYPVLSNEEQIDLAYKMKEGNLQARNKLIACNLRFVVTCAKQYVGQGVDLQDLIQAGNKGLIESCENFDPDRGYKFISFAVWYIRREILKAIYNTGRTIRYPITYINKITKVKKATEDFFKKYQKDPTDEELLNITNLTQKQYNSVLFDKSYCQSLENPVSIEGDITLGDTLRNTADEFENSLKKDSISIALKVLNSKEYKVITEFYGLEGEENKTIKEIAKEMNLGDERIRQFRKSGIKKLKARCGYLLKDLL